MLAASRTLDLRGFHRNADRSRITTGWAMAHRMLARARLSEAEHAHQIYREFIHHLTLPNLWTVHPPFQIDGNLGVMAGVVEMLLQSHAGYIAILPALPQAWSNGSFSGLVARGNFVAAADWTAGAIDRITITSRVGGLCRVALANAAGMQVHDAIGGAVDTIADARGRLSFNTQAGGVYHLRRAAP